MAVESTFAGERAVCIDFYDLFATCIYEQKQEQKFVI
jgi:hypothetical protein